MLSENESILEKIEVNKTDLCCKKKEKSPSLEILQLKETRG